MPNLNGTGPQVSGPTGRGRGNCENKTNTMGFGNGRGCGRDIGKGGSGFCALEQGDKAVLEAQIKAHQAKIDFMTNKLDELNKQDS